MIFELKFCKNYDTLMAKGAVCTTGGQPLPAECPGEVYLSSPPDGMNVQRAGNPKEEFHHGSFEYCF